MGEGVGEGMGEGVGESVGEGVGLHTHTRILKHKLSIALVAAQMGGSPGADVDQHPHSPTRSRRSCGQLAHAYAGGP